MTDRWKDVQDAFDRIAARPQSEDVWIWGLRLINQPFPVIVADPDRMVLIRQVGRYTTSPFTPPAMGVPVVAVCCSMAVNAYPKPCPHEDWHAFHNAVADLKAELLAGVERVMAWIGRRFRR